jgi:hypothetical protein
MSCWAVARWLVVAALAACARPEPARPAPVVQAAAPPVEDHDAAVAVEEAPPAPAASFDAPERSRPPSTASYEQALAKAERLDVDDGRAHLTDGQLVGPMAGVMSGCPAPQNAKVTVKTAVRLGRAIGVTVRVRFERPKSKKPPSRATLRYEAKTGSKLASCVDHAVRALVWPPSSRRDAFTMEL